LLFRKGFFAFFVTQLLSALNDNFLKNAVVIWISATRASMFGLSPDVMISLCSGVFILPFSYSPRPQVSSRIGTRSPS
jgi:hypothetical protein